MDDLNNAVDLADKYNDVKVLSLALTQRSMIRTLLKGNDKELDSDALADLERAAELGNVFAKQTLARENPYAKQCNAMLQKLMQK